jgi:hypothetical protein
VTDVTDLEDVAGWVRGAGRHADALRERGKRFRVAPPMVYYGDSPAPNSCMHPKFILLAYANGVRLVVSSCNSVSDTSSHGQVRTGGEGRPPADRREGVRDEDSE